MIEKLNGGPLEQLKFFNMATMTIDGTTVRTLRHGMAGAPGLEIWGPYADHDRIWTAIVEAGAEFGLVPGRFARLPLEHPRVGLDPVAAARASTPARPSAATASGCRADGYEATGTLAGSFVSDDIEDYYLTPWELGYGNFVKFDHDFIGRDALEQIDPASAAQEGHAGVGCRGPRQGAGRRC